MNEFIFKIIKKNIIIIYYLIAKTIKKKKIG